MEKCNWYAELRRKIVVVEKIVREDNPLHFLFELGRLGPLKVLVPAAQIILAVATVRIESLGHLGPFARMAARARLGHPDFAERKGRVLLEVLAAVRAILEEPSLLSRGKIVFAETC